MKEYDFVLKFDLPNHDSDPEQYVEALFEAGCDDASVGVGQRGRIALNFIRESDSAFNAVSSALTDVKKAIPDAKLIEATPDLVGLTDIADLVGYTRQNMRKIVIANKAAFPTPVHEGSATLWHLFVVLEWFRDKRKKTYKVDIKDSLVEVSFANMQLNLTSQLRHVDPKLQKNLQSIIG